MRNFKTKKFARLKTFERHLARFSSRMQHYPPRFGPSKFIRKTKKLKKLQKVVKYSRK